MAHQKPNTTEQVRTPPNPTGKGGFGDNPENRNPGGWKKEDTPRFKLEQMMKLSEQELRAISDDKKAPLFERKLARAINSGQWREIKEMTEQVYGRPKETVDLKADIQNNTVTQLTDEELDERIKRYLERNNAH